MHAKPKLTIGIDPDVEANGVAVRYNNEKKMFLFNKSFWELCEWLTEVKQSNLIFVVIEAGFKNKKSNFRNSGDMGLPSDNISMKVGRNHQVGILLTEFCERYKIAYEHHVPRSREIKKAIKDEKLFRSITKYMDPTNPEKRSAGMLIFDRTFPISMK